MKRQKKDLEQYVREDGEFSGDEMIVIAQVEKRFYSDDTLKPVLKEDDNGNECDTGDAYWEFREVDYTK